MAFEFGFRDVVFPTALEFFLPLLPVTVVKISASDTATNSWVDLPRTNREVFRTTNTCFFLRPLSGLFHPADRIRIEVMPLVRAKRIRVELFVASYNEELDAVLLIGTLTNPVKTRVYNKKKLG